jgi:hypothetical protein
METGQTDKARAAARRVLEKEPKVMSTAIREMREKVKQMNLPNSLPPFAGKENETDKQLTE